jgi:hypothetical protein
MVNRHQWRQSSGENRYFAGMLGPFMSLRGLISRRFGRLRERRPSGIVGSVAEPVWVYGSSRLE